jgi:hypothetical protein
MYLRVSITRCLKKKRKQSMKATIMPSNKLSSNLLKSKNSKIRERLRKKRSKKKLLKPTVMKPRKRSKKMVEDLVSSKMESQVSNLIPFPQDTDQLPVTPESL